MTDTSPTATPPGGPTMAQRAPRWIAGVVLGLIVVWVLAVMDPHSASDATVFLAMAVASGALAVINLPDTLSAGVKLACAGGGALVGVAIFWISHQYIDQHQVDNVFARSVISVFPYLTVVGASRLVARRIAEPKRG